MRSDSKELRLAMEFYCQLMQEIKIRVQGMSDLSAGPAAAQIIYESCYLQLRMICELIAIACLVAHGDIPATRKMWKLQKPKEIVERLEGLHVNFYPHPIDSKAPKGYVPNLKSGFLTKADLTELYWKCGQRLHRGTLKDVRKRIDPNNVGFDQIRVWGAKIKLLLDHHWIRMHDSDDQIGVQMRPLNESPVWNYWKHVDVDLGHAPSSQK